MSVCLVTVASGAPYQRYAEQLADSAAEFFHPDGDAGFLCLDGRDGWPDATLYRYHVLLEHEKHLRGFDYVYLVDADMRFEQTVGNEILGRLVATAHPGYVGKRERELPFERNRASQAYLQPRTGLRYYCGGFVGGVTADFLALAATIRGKIELDAWEGVTAVWHDESHLNAQLARRPPSLTLPPSYCYPDNDAGYVTWWPERYERKLVALDKPEHERRGR